MATALLMIIYISFIALGIPDSLFGAAWPAIYPDLGVPLSLASVYSLTGSLATLCASLLSGRVLGRFGTARVTAASTVLTALGLLAFSLCGRFWLLVLCAIPLGLGAGAVDTALNNYVALHYSATHMSFLHCFYGVGVSLSPWLLGYMLSATGSWRSGYRLMFAIQGAIALAVVLSLPLWKRVNRRQEERPEEAGVPMAVILRQRRARVSLGTVFASCALEALCLGWSSTYLVEGRGMSPADAAQTVTVYFVGMTLGRFLSGVLAKRLKPMGILGLGLWVVAGAVVLLLAPLPVWAAAAALFLVGLGNGPVFPNITYLAPIHFGKDGCRTYIALQMAAGNAAFMLCPVVFGLLTRLWGMGLFPWACLGMFCLAAGAAVALGRCKGGTLDD